MRSKEVTDFYYCFSRSEYALKASGFLLSHDGAMPNWDRFANDIKEKL